MVIAGHVIHPVNFTTSARGIPIVPRDAQRNIERGHVSRESNHISSHSTELGGSSNANVRNSARKLVQLRHERVQECSTTP